MRTIVLDNEAVQALQDPHHRKHAEVLSHITSVVARRKRGVATGLVVPTAVRVEAGWDRTSPEAATMNRYRVSDRPLDTNAANHAATLRMDHGVSVVDAHLGQVARALVTDGHDVVVLTSDPGDMAKSAGPNARIVTI